MLPCGLWKPRKPRRNGKENQIQLFKLFLVEEEEKEGIFLTFPCRTKSSITCRNTQACFHTNTHTRISLAVLRRASGASESSTLKLAWFWLVSLHLVLGWPSRMCQQLSISCTALVGMWQRLTVASGKSFAHSVHCISAAHSWIVWCWSDGKTLGGKCPTTSTLSQQTQEFRNLNDGWKSGLVYVYV